MTRALSSDEDFVGVFPQDEEEEEEYQEHSCSSPDIPAEQLSDCECTISQVPTDSTPCLAICKQPLDTTDLLGEDCVHIRRIKTCRKKIYDHIEGISVFIGNTTEPDGIDQFRRRQRRVVEFLAWICRNYHFILRKQISHIKKEIKKPCDGARYTFFNAVAQKLAFTHQTTVQALQAYEHHLPTTVGTGVHGKLRELLKHVLDLCQINRKIGIIDGGDLCEDDDYVETKTRCLLQRLHIKREFGIQAFGTCTSISQANSHKKPAGGNSKVDLSMYEPKTQPTKCIGKCRKKASVLARTKFGPPPKQKSKPKAAVHRVCTMTNMSEQGSSENSKFQGPPPVSKSVLDAPMKQKRSRVRKKSVPTSVSLFDNVKTMMEFIPNEQSENEEGANQRLNPKVQGEAGDNPGGKVVKHNVIETLIGLAESVRSQLDEGKKILECKLSAEEIRPTWKSTAKKKHSGGNLTTVDIDSLNQINELMQQLEEVLPNNSSQAVCRKSSSKSLGNRGELNSSSSNARLIIVEHESSEERVHENERNITENLQPLSAGSSCSTLIGEVPTLSAGVDVKIPRDWEPSMDPRRKNGMIISTIPNLPADEQMKPAVSTREDSISQPAANAVPRPSLVTLMVFSAEKRSLLDYHRIFHNYASKRRMYDEQKKPWVIVTRVADYLIHNILKDLVSNEIGMHKIAENLVDLEFK